MWGKEADWCGLLPSCCELCREFCRTSNFPSHPLLPLPALKRPPTQHPSLLQTATGWQQALDVGEKLRGMLEEADGSQFRLFVYTSPYLRCKQVGSRVPGPLAHTT